MASSSDFARLWPGKRSSHQQRNSRKSTASCPRLHSCIVGAGSFWNTRYMQAALDHLQATGYPVQDSDLEHLSPIISAHIYLHGSHHLDL
ncbi:MAG TPA: Tn3 family transposase [Ktedonobacteraceae bacterium]